MKFNYYLDNAPDEILDLSLMEALQRDRGPIVARLERAGVLSVSAEVSSVPWEVDEMRADDDGMRVRS